MLRFSSCRKFAARARAVRRAALVVGLFAAVVVIPYAGVGAWQGGEEAGARSKSQLAVKGQANIVAGAEFVPGDVLVRFRTETAARAAEAVSMPLSEEAGGEVSFARIGATDMVAELRLAKVDPARTLAAVAELASRPEVLYAEPNYIWRANRTPNDPRYVSGEMYGLNKIGAPAAWNTTVGSRNVVVGVLDGGVDINHEDLKANIWKNPGEVPGNGFDDDGNGFTDDINGWDFDHGDNSVFDNEPGDEHGTHVAGTIGASGDNNLGVTGVNWEVSIISIKVLGPEGGAVSNIINGYNYARNLRAAGVNLRVLNNSYSGSGKSLAALEAINQLNNAGILFVAAASNDARDNFIYPAYPANYDAANVLAVASTTSTDGLSGFSNFGARVVSIAAPGSSILSTTPNNTYSVFNGTSMASPHVAGAAALICAANPTCAGNSAANSGITTAQLRGLLVYGGDRINALDGKTTTGRRLNVANAVTSALQNDVTTPALPGNFRVTGQSGRGVTLAWTAPGDDTNTGLAADYDLFFVNPTTQARTLLPTTLVPAAPGTAQTIAVNVPFVNFSGTIQLRTYDDTGNTSTASVNVTIPVNSNSDPYTVSLSAASGLAPMTGTSLVTGDDKYASYNLPFAFPFYGASRNSLTVSTNGALYFSTPPRRDDGDADDVPGYVQALQGQTMIAGLWDDIDINPAVRPDSGIFVTQPDATRIIIRWQGVTFLSPRVNVNMEIELRGDGTIQMRYGDNPRVFPVVGISGGEPDAYVIASHTRESVSSTQPISLSNAQTVTFAPRAGSLTLGGQVTVGGTALSGVTITLSGAQSATATTDNAGNYLFGNLNAGDSYTVTPSKLGYSFTPPSMSFTNIGSTSPTANFTATAQPQGNVCAQHQPIASGQTINGTLATGDCLNPVDNDGSKVDEYTFSASAGQQIAVSLSSTDFDTFLYLLRPDGTVLASNDDTSGSTNSRIPETGFFTLPSSGVYSILASSYRPEDSGAYSLTLTANTICNLTPIAYGETKTGTLASGDCTNTIDQDGTFVDYYTFSGTAGQQIAVTMTATSGSIDPYLYLLTAKGDRLAEDANGGGGTTARIPAGAGFGRLPITGNYMIVVNTTLASQSGNYSLTLTKAATDCPSVPLTAGTTASGALANGDCRLLEDGSFLDAYTFTGKANTQVVITMTSSTAGLAPVVFLLAPTGEALAVDPNTDGDNTAGIPAGMSVFALPTTGTYTVLANSVSANQVGNYTLALQKNAHTISGRVTGGGSGLSGITVNLSGGATASTTTDANGNYSFVDLIDGNNYTVTPANSARYSFTSQTVNALQADQTVDFDGTLRAYTVSGQVTTGGSGLSGATVTLTGPAGFTTRNATTSANGNYSFPEVPAGGNYTVTATMANYTFAPSDVAVMNLLADRAGVNFVGTLRTYTLGGRIMVGANGLPGVGVALSGSATGMTQTDANGNYSFTVTAGGTYTLTPARTHYTFAPASQVFNNLASNQTADFNGTLNTYTIGGRVTVGSANLDGVTVTLGGAQTATTQTDANGNYTFANLTAGSTYTVTVAKQNYTFAPPSRTFTDLSGNQSAADFAATLNTYTIGGRVSDASSTGLSGVTVTLSGTEARTALTDANGNYSFSGVTATGNYTLTAVKQHYTFAPPSRTFTNLSGNQTTADFTATLNTHTLGGVITDANGGLDGVTVSLTGAQSATAQTDANGNYAFANLTAGSTYTVTAAKQNYTFAPPSRTFSDLSGNQSAADFAATLNTYTIGGLVTDASSTGLSGVTVTLGGSEARTALTDANGNYSFSGVTATGNYTVTAAKQHHTFAPPSRTFTNLSGNQSAADFTATLNTHTLGGVITDANGGLGGVTVSLTGAQSATTQTDANGNYAFANLPAGSSYTVTAAKQNYTFAPPSRTFTNLSGNQSAANFAATLNTYTIGGRVSLASGGLGGVTVSLSGSQSATTQTDANGNYSFNVTAGGTYTVTPSKAFYSFDAPSQTFAAISTGQTANFTATLLTYTLSGRVSQGALGLSGVTITLSGDRVGTTTTDAQGNYSFSNLTGGGSVVVTPTRAFYTFAPASRSVNIDGERAGVNFDATPVPNIIRFTSNNYQVGEADGRVTLTVTRTGDLSGTATVDYRSIDTDTFTVGCFDSVNNNGGAYARCDFATTVGTLSFAPGEASKQLTVPVIDDGHAEAPETFQLRLSNPAGATLDATDVASVTLTDNDAAGAGNPVLTHPFFVRQQYLDFLSREPDTAGFNAWLGLLNGCPNAFGQPSAPSGCDRIFVSGEGFFRSVEFQLKGFYVFRFYKAGFNRLPEYLEVVSDMSYVAGQTAEEVYARKAQLATRFTERPEFQTAYGGMSEAQYVAALLGRYNLTEITTPDPAQPDGNKKVTLTSADLTNLLSAKTLTRAQVLRAVADSDAVGTAEFNNAFVGMQYYGYLRRKPDQNGFNAWLGVLQSGNVRTMVDGFLNSTEYKLRFGQP